MLFYKSHQLCIAGAAFEIPDGIYLDTDPEGIDQNTVVLITSDGSVTITVAGEYSYHSAAEYFISVGFKAEGFQIFSEVTPITRSGLNGCYLVYGNAHTRYCEYRFDLPNGSKEANALCIVTAAETADFERAVNGREITALVDSVHKV